MKKTQVVIIGAGPTGLSMAAQLIRYNVDFIILEKNATTTELSKAIVVQARTLEIFKELGVADEAIRRGRVTTDMNLFYKGKVRAEVHLSNLGQGQSDFPFGLSLEQSKTEKLLIEYLNKHGKDVQWRSELLNFAQDDRGVEVQYKDVAGMEQIIHADYLVGCDGAGSVVRHKLGFTFEGSTEPKLFYVADVILESSVMNRDALYMHMIRKGFILFFPMVGEGHYRIVGILPEHEGAKAEYQFSEIAPTIREQIITPVEFKELRWFSTYRVHSRKANTFIKGRCFIGGDAAHIHTPAGGQGMNTGIQDAYNLAWKMSLVLRGELKADVLKTYNTERTANAKNLLQTTDRMFDIMSGVNRFWNFLRLNFFPAFLSLLSKSKFARRKMFPMLSQIGIAYPDSTLTTRSSLGIVKAGDRMHYFLFADRRSIFSYLQEPVFKLLYFGKDLVPNPVADIQLQVEFLSFAEIPHFLFRDEKDFYILLRPDNHISYIGKDTSQCRNLLLSISCVIPKVSLSLK